VVVPHVEYMGWVGCEEQSVCEKLVEYMGYGRRHEEGRVVTLKADIEPRVTSDEIAVSVGDGLGDRLH
jgi:hypothetical protein